MWNSLGAAAAHIARSVLSLHPRTHLIQNVRVGSRIVGFSVRVGERVALIEAKYSLPSRAGDSLTRLTAQVNAALASGQGQVVLWTLRGPRSVAELRRVMGAIGNSSSVQFVHGAEGLFRWMQLFFGRF